MAIQAKFVADFSSFTSAVEQAETKLVGFQANAGKVETALNRMVNNFSGTKVIQDATLMVEAVDRIGGVSKLTGTELQTVAARAQEAAAKLAAMGQDVPPKLQALADQVKGAGGTLANFKNIIVEVAGALGLAFGASAAIQFGKRFVDDVVQSASALVDLNTKTGVSIEQLQRFAFVGKQAGVTVEDFAQSSFKLGVNLAGGQDSVKGGVDKLKLSWEALKTQSPEEQFNAVVDALGKMTNTQERNRIGVELFGKSFATIVPAIEAGYSHMASAATVSSAAQVKAIDDAGDAWDRFVAKQKAGVTSALGNILLLHNAVAKLPEGYATFLLQTDKSIKSIEDLDAALIRAAGATDVVIPTQKAAADATADYGAKLAEANAQLAGLTATQRAGINDALKLGEAHAKIADNFKISEQALTLYIERQRIATQASTEFQRAIENLYPLLKSPVWDGTAKSLLELGGAVEDVAIYTGIWKGEVKGLKADLDDENAVLDRLNEAMREQAKEIDEAVKSINKGGGLHQTLLNLAQAMGDVRLASKDFIGAVDLMPDSTDRAARHMADLTDRSKEFTRDFQNAFSGAEDVLGDFDGAFARVGQDVLRTVGAVANRLEQGDVFGATVAAIAGGIHTLVDIGGPSKDELAARNTFGNFQKQFGSLQQTIDAVGKAYAQVGKTGVEAQQDLKRALDATHLSAAAEQQALEKINGVLQTQQQFIQNAQQLGGSILGNANDIIGGSGFGDLHGQLTSAQNKVAGLQKQGITGGGDYDAAAKELADVNAKIAASAKTAGGALADLGTEAVAAFAAAVGSGQSESQALKALHPSLTTLADAYHDLGLSTDNVALHTLLMRDQILQSAPGLVTAIGGVTSEMDALNQLGLLNKDTLEALERTGAQTYGTLLAKVHDLGGSDKDALSEMQDFLHKAADAAQKLGIPLDATTQDLITQSQQGGIWQDAITPQDKLLKGMQDLVDKVGKLLDHLNGIPASVSTTVNVGWNVAPPPDFASLIPGGLPALDIPGASTGGIIVPSGIEHFAGGGMVGEDNRIIAAKDGEVILNDSQQKKLLGLASGRGSNADWRALADQFKAMQRRQDEQTRILRRIPVDITSAILTASRGRR